MGRDESDCDLGPQPAAAGALITVCTGNSSLNNEVVLNA